MNALAYAWSNYKNSLRKKWSIRTGSTLSKPYQVSIQPKDGNRCPYSFMCWFRTSDLLVMRRELRQPTATRTGRPFSGPVVQANYAKDEAMPFMPADFPNLRGRAYGVSS